MERTRHEQAARALKKRGCKYPWEAAALLDPEHFETPEALERAIGELRGRCPDLFEERRFFGGKLRRFRRAS